MKNLQSVKLTGKFNRVDPARSLDEADLHIVGYQVQNLTLSKNQDFPVALNKGMADFEASSRIANESLDAKISAGLKSVQILAKLSENPKPLTKAMASTLSDIKGFNFKAEISGTVKDYDVRLTSDLDRVLAEAIGKQVKEQATQFEMKLKAVVSQKVDRELADLKTNLGEMAPFVDELTSRLKLGDTVLKELFETGKGGLKLPF